MAQKTSAKKKTNIRRFKAEDSGAKKSAASIKTDEANAVIKEMKTTKKETEIAKKATKKKRNFPGRRLIGYFKGAWKELKQVRWPTRGATWSMTGAVLLFTLMFVILILLLDAGYEWVFEQILK